MSSSSRQPTPRRRNSISSVPVTSGQPDLRPSIPALNLPAGFPVDSTETDPNSAKDEDLDLNNVQVIDDLSINRWLLRIVRLGASYVSTGSNGYKTAAGKSVPATSSGVGGYLNSLRAGGRRYSACEPTSALLRPAMTTRGRRLSDCINMNNGSFKFQRRGAEKSRNYNLQHFDIFVLSAVYHLLSFSSHYKEKGCSH